MEKKKKNEFVKTFVAIQLAHSERTDLVVA
jgi:hypothetical protein